MRAVEPDVFATLTREGVDVAYEVFGSGDRTIVFTPPDSIVDARCWKAQVPFLSRHARVVTIDPRGNGRSGRPTDPAAYADAEYAADTIAVMDELGIASAILVGICTSGWSAALVAAHQPERVDGMVVVAPKVPHVTPPMPARSVFDFDAVLDTDEGWAKDNRHYRLRDYRGFVEFFFDALLVEPHSSKQWEDCVGWGLNSTAEIQNAIRDAPQSVSDADDVYAVLAKVNCPALVIHGDEDACQPSRRAEILAEVLGADRITIVGAGHLPMCREPVTVNLAIRDFIERVRPQPVRRRLTVPSRAQRKLLYLSSPIGLGHARRDMAIADELMKLHADVKVDWLAQQPLAGWLERRGMNVHPASAWLANESAHIDSVAGEHNLHAFQAIREMDEILIANFMVFQELVEQERYDLWVGDEAWELDYFLHENPQLKTTPYAWLTDFVGWLPMTDGREADLTADYNAEMIDQMARSPKLRDRSIFVGNPDDVVSASFGPGLPDIATWTNERYAFAGYVTGFDAAEIADRAGLRAEFGFEADEPVCLVAVGGSGVGTHLLRRAIEAYPAAARQVPGLRMIVVAGPRIDPASLSAPPGVEVHPFLPDLHRRLAACDIALVQGGLTTTMELTAAGRPFIYVPLDNHFEQNFHVRKRLANYGAGSCVPWRDATPEHLAELIARDIGSTPAYRPVESGGAARAAQLLADLL
jgi:pimeloyl-ACP methyl ester carboxylesterase/predicted glycosyltransferase